MLMEVKDFFKPTRGRILIFIIIFLSVFVYDTAFAPFPGSPVVENMGTQEGASSFLLYVLVLPYVLSCLIPAFFGLRKKKFLRMSRLTEFMHPRHASQKPKAAKQQTFTFPAGTPTVESVLPSPAGEPASGPKTKSAAKQTTAAKKPAEKKSSSRKASATKPGKK